MPQVILKCIGNQYLDCNIVVRKPEDPKGITYSCSEEYGIPMNYTQMKELLKYLGFEILDDNK